MPGFLRGPVSRVTGNAPQVPEKDLTGATVGKHPNSGVPPTLLGILTKYDGVGGVLHKGLQRTGKKNTNLPIQFVHHHMQIIDGNCWVIILFSPWRC